MGNNSFANVTSIGDKGIYTWYSSFEGPKTCSRSTSEPNLDGFHNHFGNKRWTLTKGSLVVVRGKLSSTL